MCVFEYVGAFVRVYMCTCFRVCVCLLMRAVCVLVYPFMFWIMRVFVYVHE